MEFGFLALGVFFRLLGTVGTGAGALQFGHRQIESGNLLSVRCRDATGWQDYSSIGR